MTQIIYIAVYKLIKILSRVIFLANSQIMDTVLLASFCSWITDWVITWDMIRFSTLYCFFQHFSCSFAFISSKSSQVTFIYIALLTIQIVSKQRHNIKTGTFFELKAFHYWIQWCHCPAQFSLNSICEIKSVISLEMKCPQLSKPEATTARNQNCIGDRTEKKKTWEKPGSVGSEFLHLTLRA